jgi:transcriptional regulator GlxA family with amidase domain
MHSRLDSIQDGQWEALAKKAGYNPESLPTFCGVSLRQLERFFKSRFEETPSAWLLELRLQDARSLLRRGLSTKAIAQELGFANAAHSCHAFKIAHGRPPQTFALLEPPDVA